MSNCNGHPVSHLILGGARSGKTAYALSVANDLHLEKWMVATAHAGDPEMRERIARHQAERGADWGVIEERISLVEVLRARSRPECVLVIDCLTLWLSNLFVEKSDLSVEIGQLTHAITDIGGPVLLVSNEIGLGLVPESELGRAFRDAQGALNQKIAAVCDAVTFVVAGLPIALKTNAGF